MRKLAILLTLLMIPVLAQGVIGCGGGGGAAGNPEATVRNLLRAVESRNANAIVGYCSERPSDSELESLQRDWNEVDRVRVYNITTRVVSQNEDRATVEYECDLEITAYGETHQVHTSETENLVKKNGKWYIEDCLN